MNGFDLVGGCTAAQAFRCYSEFQPSQIPNLAALARQYVISDRTFEQDAIPSWGAHLELAAGTLDGFLRDNPWPAPGVTPLRGWGCESHTEALWRSGPGSAGQRVRSCVPKQDGSGAYRDTPVRWVPTIMDRLDAARDPWTICTERAQNWAICPTFADCWDTSQRRHLNGTTAILDDARNGTLPAFSILLPSGPGGRTSQHNRTSMLAGDNSIGQVVAALQRSPEWSSTAVFITYDDCGCFYDHVAPPAGDGVRVPTVIVSPHARAPFTDSRAGRQTDSILAFTEHVFGLPPLSSADANAYDYADSFTAALDLTPVTLVQRPIPAATLAELAANPPDSSDPT